MRAFVTLYEDPASASTVARFDVFPSVAGSSVRATVSTLKTLAFPDGHVDDVRAALRARPDPWSELVGPDVSFADWEATMTCDAGAPLPPLSPVGLLQCSPDPGASPLANRALFDISRGPDSFDASYEILPSNFGDENMPVTIASKVTVSLFDMADVSAARAALLDPANGLGDQVLADSGLTYAMVDAALKCS
jgi:hypothetical protein